MGLGPDPRQYRAPPTPIPKSQCSKPVPTGVYNRSYSTFCRPEAEQQAADRRFLSTHLGCDLSSSSTVTLFHAMKDVLFISGETIDLLHSIQIHYCISTSASTTPHTQRDNRDTGVRRRITNAEAETISNRARVSLTDGSWFLSEGLTVCS